MILLIMAICIVGLAILYSGAITLLDTSSTALTVFKGLLGVELFLIVLYWVYKMVIIFKV